MARTIDRRRRNMLLVGAALLLQTTSSPIAVPLKKRKRTVVSLASYGGVPGADPSVLKEAFAKAYAELASLGGGELLVAPGEYDFGSNLGPANIISSEGLSDVVISAYGATFVATTTADVIPNMFHFTDPDNVVIAGASFRDRGFDPNVDWRGMYCVRAEATRPCSGFSVVDCRAESVLGLFYSNQKSHKFLLKDISVQGYVSNAYYGVGATYVGDNTRVILTCENVRRGFISYGLRNADVNIRMKSNPGFIGSNGFVSLIAEGESHGNVENIRINLEVSGVGSHGGLVHFYHQEKERRGYMCNIDATVTVNNLIKGKATTNVFLFDHQLPNAAILACTERGWDRICLHGSVTGSLSGRVISNPSVSTSPSTVYVDANLIVPKQLSRLPAYFRIKSL